jgi:glycosyltransferase involved in cell wall biosynthesis
MNCKPMRKSILIASYYFHPENTPRAFRVFELAKGFARQGHDVTVYIPESPAELSGIAQRYGFAIRRVPTGFLINRRDKHGQAGGTRVMSGAGPGMPARMLKLLHRAYHTIYFDDRRTEYAWCLYRALRGDRRTYDGLISVSLPFAVHVGTALALRSRPRLARTRIAECGDPYSANPTSLHAFYEPALERRVLGCFDHVTVPTERAIPFYAPFKPRERIHVVPHGFDFEEVERGAYAPHSVPTFAYAGAFHADVVNPRFLLEFLSRLGRDFRFIIYTGLAPSARVLKADVVNALEQYGRILGGKLTVRPLIPRLECIRQLSTMDFLVSIDTLSPSQKPSKLVDYALSGRPIINCSERTFDPDHFRAFLQGDYSAALAVDLEPHRIENVCRQFLQLIG